MVERAGLAPRHLAAFAVVALAGPLTVSDLAARAGLALSTASLLVTQLADAGLVERREDEGDRRRTVVSVAPAYRAESEAVLEEKLAPLREAVLRMGPVRAKATLEGLAILAEVVSPRDGHRHSTPEAGTPPVTPRPSSRDAAAPGSETHQ
jgi:DNA-binding MarR family transcriptional regulator